MKCNTCKSKDAYDACRFPEPGACSSCPCLGCFMCKEQQQVVAIQDEKIRRIEAATGKQLLLWQKLYVLCLGDVPSSASIEDKRHAQYIRTCLQIPPYAKGSGSERLQKINVHRLEDAAARARLCGESAASYKYHLKNVYKLLSEAGLRLKTVIF